MDKTSAELRIKVQVEQVSLVLLLLQDLTILHFNNNDITFLCCHFIFRSNKAVGGGGDLNIRLALDNV